MKLVSKNKDKFASIAIEDLKLGKRPQKIPLAIVESFHARFQDSDEIIKQKVKSFIDTSQGEISLCIFDSILGGNRASWDKTTWVAKDFDEALTFDDVSYTM
jgi:hypothetical protein